MFFLAKWLPLVLGPLDDMESLTTAELFRAAQEASDTAEAALADAADSIKEEVLVLLGTGHAATV